MNRHHTGSGRRSVIPTDWETHHAGVAAQTHTATVKISLPGGEPVFNEETKQTETPEATQAYDGTARIQLESATSDRAQTADDEVALRRYVISIDRGATGITPEHVVKVTACSDTDLVGRTLHIGAISHGSLRFETALHCTLID